MVDQNHTRQRSGSPTGNPDKTQAPAVSSPPATEIGGAPAVWTGGDTSGALSPNSVPQFRQPWVYPQVITVPALGTADVNFGTVPEWWVVTQIDAGTCAVAFVPNGGGLRIPMQQGWSLKMPGQANMVSLVGDASVSVRFVVIAVSGHDTDRIKLGQGV